MFDSAGGNIDATTYSRGIIFRFTIGVASTGGKSRAAGHSDSSPIRFT
jgi:hypothetical protein